MSRKLTPKQKKFADNYIKSGNATQSAIDADYSKKAARSIGQENLTKPDIKSYIDECMQQIEDEKIADATEVLQYFTSVLRGEVEETVVVGGPMGAETVDKPPDIKTRLSAGKELLKRYPGNDKLVEQQIRKLSAEADIAEGRAAEFNGDSDAGEVVIVDDIPEDETDD
ncbi:terminase small subunit [Loigolactobacillus coryniformis]|uniref:terminase small subunit n=1 Tax=Loigolactobacillus coryniformis TaxID=1610 RepID=UPI003F20510C